MEIRSFIEKYEATIRGKQQKSWAKVNEKRNDAKELRGVSVNTSKHPEVPTTPPKTPRAPRRGLFVGNVGPR